MNFGKSHAKMHGEGKVKVSFKDVAGADEAKPIALSSAYAPKMLMNVAARLPKTPIKIASIIKPAPVVMPLPAIALTRKIFFSASVTQANSCSWVR